MTSTGTHNLSFSFRDLSAAGALPDVETRDVEFGTGPVTIDWSPANPLFSGTISGGFELGLSPTFESWSLGDLDLDLGFDSDWQVVDLGAGPELQLGSRVAEGPVTLDADGPGLGSNGLDLYFDFDGLDLNLDFGVADFESEIPPAALDLTLFETVFAPPQFSVLPELGLLSGNVGLSVGTSASFLDPDGEIGPTEPAVTVALDLPELSADSTDVTRVPDLEDGLRNLRSAVTTDFASLTLDLDRLLSVIPGVPPLGFKTEVLEGLELAGSLLDLDVSANLGVGTTFELDPEEITVRLLDPAGAVVGEGPIGTSFDIAGLSAATDEAIELTAEYRLDATLTQALTVVPSLTLPGKIAAVSASADFDVFGLSLGATEVSAAFAESDDLFAQFGFDPLESLGFDTSEGWPLPGTEVSAPLADLVPPEALVLTRDIVIPPDTGPVRTATAPIVGPDGSQIGSQGLTLPSYTTDGTVDYRVTLSTQAQATQYNIAFIIDRSDSMNDEAKIEAAKAAFLDLIDFLETEGIAAAANFAVIPFNDRASLFEGLSPEEAAQQIAGISAAGFTAFGPPLGKAEQFFSGAPSGATNIAYFLSDGQSNDNDESASLQAFADVRAFALGSNADTAALDVIDSNTAEDLSAPSDLADAFGASGVDTAALDRVEIRVDGALADTIPVESFADTPLGLSYEGTLSGIAAADPSDTVQARTILETGTTGSVIELEITDGGPSGTPGPGPDRLAMARTATEIDAGGGDDAVTGNALGNVIVLGQGDDTADGGPGDDLIRPGDDGDDRISGGPGIDTVVYDGTLDEIGPVSREGNLVRVGTGTDVLDGVEFVRFADTRIATETLDAAPEISAMVTGAAEPPTGTADATLSLRLSEPFASDRLVTLATAPGTAEPGLDYVPLAGTIPIAAGTTEVRVSLPILADDLVEGRESFVLDLAAPSDATFANGKAARQLEVPILDEDRPSELSVRVPEPQVSEPRPGESANIAFEVVRSGDTGRSGSVDWRVEGTGPAPATPDDIAVPAFAGGRVFLAAGETVARIALPVAADALDEGPEGLRLVLSNASDGLRIVDGSAAAVLRDPQPPIDSTGTPEVSLDAIALDPERVEGDTGATPFRFEISRSGETGLPVSVDWRIEGNGADGADFAGGTLPSGRIDLAAGETSREIRIDVAGDRVDEGDEAFTFALGNADAGTATAVIAAAPVDAVINDDDAPTANLAIVPVEAGRAEGDADSTPFTFEVSRTGDTNGDLSVDYAVSGAGPEDFAGGVRPSGTVSFADGETTETITVDVRGDTAVEPDEDFTVVLSNASDDALITAASAGGTILNDDRPAVSVGDASIAEGDPGDASRLVFDLSLDQPGVREVRVDLVTAAGGTASEGGDFLPASETVVFPPGRTGASVEVEILEDTEIEPDETVSVRLVSPVNADLGQASGTGTILDDDAPPSSISIAPGNAERGEGTGGSTNFTFSLTRTGSISNAATVDWRVAGDQVTGADFAGGATPSGTTGFSPGQTTTSIRVPVFGDTIEEPDEAFEVVLSNPTGAGIEAGRASGLIIDDDAVRATVVSIEARDAARDEGDAGATAVSFTISRSANTSQPVTVGWEVVGSEVDADDFVGGALPEGEVDFLSPGVSSQTLTILARGDTDFEADEEVTVRLTSVTGDAVIGVSQAKATLRNDDVPEDPDLPEGVIRGTARPDAMTAGSGVIYLPDDGPNTFVIGEAAVPGETAVLDGAAGDLVQLAGGLEIFAFQLTPSALSLDILDGRQLARVQLLDADTLEFEAGGNVTTGEAGPVQSFEQFAISVLGVAPPVSGVQSGGGIVVPDATGTDPVSPVPGEPSRAEGVQRGTDRADVLLAGAGAIYLPGEGPDRIVVSEAATPGETGVITVDSDDVIELVAGLEIESFLLTPRALNLDLATGARVQVLNADAGGYAPTANATTGTAAEVLSLSEFARQVLGVTLPEANGAVTGTDIVIGTPPAGTGVDVLIDRAETVTGTPGADTFRMRVDDSRGTITNPDFDGAATIAEFDPGSDRIVFENVPGSSVTAQDILAEDGLAVLELPIPPTRLTYVFNDDPTVAGTDGAILEIPGVAEQDPDGDGVLDFVEMT